MRVDGFVNSLPFQYQESLTTPRLLTGPACFPKPVSPRRKWWDQILMFFHRLPSMAARTGTARKRAILLPSPLLRTTAGLYSSGPRLWPQNSTAQSAPAKDFQELCLYSRFLCAVRADASLRGETCGATAAIAGAHSG